MRWTAGAWFTVAVAGQLIFAAYVFVLYGRATLAGQFEGWNRAMPHGYVAGDPVGNTAVGLHLAAAVAVLVAGALQFVPWLRQAAPKLHRLSGRVYLTGAAAASLAGLWMVWTRGTVGGLEASITLNGLLMLAFAWLTWRRAVERQFAAHRRWALRLFLASSGVWFFRIGLMLWLAIHRAPVGFDAKTFKGPFLTFLGYAQFLIPLALLEVYFLVRAGQSGPARLALAVALAALTVATGLGVGVAALGMWIPRL